MNCCSPRVISICIGVEGVGVVLLLYSSVDGSGRNQSLFASSVGEELSLGAGFVGVCVGVVDRSLSLSLTLNKALVSVRVGVGVAPSSLVSNNGVVGAGVE